MIPPEKSSCQWQMSSFYNFTTFEPVSYMLASFLQHFWLRFIQCSLVLLSAKPTSLLTNHPMKKNAALVVINPMATTIKNMSNATIMSTSPAPATTMMAPQHLPPKTTKTSMPKHALFHKDCIYLGCQQVESFTHCWWQ